MKIHKRTFIKILRIGIPSGIQGSLFSISNVIIQSSINSFGELAVSGAAAAGNIEGFSYILMNSFYQTSLNFTGQNVGAKNYKRVKKVLFLCMACVTTVGICIGLLIYSFGKPLLSIYITDSPEAIEFGMIRFLGVCLPYFLCGLMEVVTGTVRGMGCSLPPMIITVLGVCGMRIVWIYTIFQMPQFHTFFALFISYPISWAISASAQLILFGIIYKKALSKG